MCLVRVAVRISTSVASTMTSMFASIASILNVIHRDTILIHHHFFTVLFTVIFFAVVKLFIVLFEVFMIIVLFTWLASDHWNVAPSLMTTVGIRMVFCSHKLLSSGNLWEIICFLIVG